MKSFGEKVHELRVAKGMSQEAVARAAMISLKQMHQIEHGKSMPRWDTGVQVMQALGCEPWEFLAPPEVLAYAAHCRALPAPQRARIVRAHEAGSSATGPDAEPPILDEAQVAELADLLVTIRRRAGPAAAEALAVYLAARPTPGDIERVAAAVRARRVVKGRRSK